MYGRSASVPSVVFVEANPFASRLHVLGPLVAGAVAAGQNAYVVLPRRPAGADLDSFLGDLPKTTQIIWVEKTYAKPREMIPMKQFLRVILAARRVLHGKYHGTLILTAIDDYFSKLTVSAGFVSVLFHRARVIAIRYRVDDLIGGNDAKSARYWLKSAAFAVISFCVRPEIVTFDERVPMHRAMHVLPDPWTGPFGRATRSEHRGRLGWKDDDAVVLLVGMQDLRKGFDVASRALDAVHRVRPSVKVLLVGGVTPDLDTHLSDLKLAFGENFKQITTYISDEDLAGYFAASSLVLLPYYSKFTSTSGVLARAAASGTPVVASSHGLVGWRTVRYALGTVFPYPDVSALAQEILRSLDHKFDSTRAREFAQSCTSEALAATFGNVVQNA